MKFLTILNIRERFEGFCIPVAAVPAAAECNTEAGLLCKAARSSDPRIGVVNPDSIPLAITDIEQICSASNCGYKGGKGKQPFRRALLGGPGVTTTAYGAEYCRDFTQRWL